MLPSAAPAPAQPSDGAAAPAALFLFAALQQPVFLLDATARVLATNPAGREFLGDATVLGSTAHGLQASAAAETSQLRKAVAVVAQATPERPRSQQVSLSRGPSLDPVAVLLMPWHQAGILAIVHEPAGQLADTAERFAMTAAELALVEDLLQGFRLKQVALRRGRSVNTIRTQMAAVLKKTQTNSQADLIRVLMRPS